MPRLGGLLCLAFFGAAAAQGWVDPCSEGPLPAETAAEDNHTKWREVLQQHVTPGQLGGISATLVDYDAIRTDPTHMRDYMRQFCTVALSALSVPARTALLINAYNVMMVAIVVHYRLIDSVLEVGDMVSEGSVWRHKFMTIGGTRHSPDDVEHGLLRNSGLSEQAGVKGRLHAGVVCASLSCPDLQLEPYYEDKLVDQLTVATQRWLANPTKNPGPSSSGNSATLSKIFDWYRSDFVAAAGSVVDFVNTYSSYDLPSGASLSYIDYNWALNKAGGTGNYEGGAMPSWSSPFLALALSLAALVLR